jgi:hypothetical protein
MNFENFNQKSNKLKKLLRPVLAASVILTETAGCDSHSNNQIDNKPDRFEKQTSLTNTFEINKGKSVLDQKKLDLYFKSMKEGSFDFGKNSHFNELIKCRAIDISMKKGIKVQWDSKVIFKAIGCVPVEIEIDGMPVPVNTADYTQEELNMVRVSQSIQDSLHLHKSSSTPKPDSETKTSPEIKDFL